MYLTFTLSLKIYLVSYNYKLTKSVITAFKIELNNIQSCCLGNQDILSEINV